MLLFVILSPGTPRREGGETTETRSGSQRVLVVDDAGEMRALIRRTLGTAGYQVDLASSLAEARGMDPSSYDAVVVDARLGADRGTDLIEELTSADPAAPRRCLVITGGPRDALPDGVASLAKPFRLAELLTAVRTLHQPGAGGEQDQRAQATWPAGTGAATAAPSAAGTGEPAAVPCAPCAAGSAGPMAWQLLGLTRRLRARERGELAGFLHDGPVQDLAAASLELQLLRRSVVPALAAPLDAVVKRLDAVARPLRAVVNEAGPALVSEPGLAGALGQRAAWLLATPLAVDAEPACAGLAATEVAAVVDVAELMLFAMTPALPPDEARVEVRAADDLIGITVTIVPAVGGEPADDSAAAQGTLSELATALSAGVGSDFGRTLWRSWITLPRAAAGAA
jgi:CheY-like chemotaxis protein